MVIVCGAEEVVYLMTRTVSCTTGMFYNPFLLSPLFRSFISNSEIQSQEGAKPKEKILVG